MCLRRRIDVNQIFEHGIPEGMMKDLCLYVVS
jgi:hypothetical protein